MNLDDLRTQLRDQATEIDPATPVPLPTIRRRAKTVKRRRAAAAITAAAAAVAIALAVLPGTLNTSTPDPTKPPPDYTRDGITIPGTVGPDRLEKAEIGKPGAGPLEFTWTPTSTSVTFRPYCRTTATKPLSVKITVNGREVAMDKCDDVGRSPVHENPASPGHMLWIEAPVGKLAEVRVVVTDKQTQLEVDAAVAQLAVGIYRSPEQATTFRPPAEAGLPVRKLPPSSGDYLKDGIRFRAKMAGNTLLGATVGATGQRTVKLRFTATGKTTELRFLCTADRENFRRAPDLTIRINGRSGGRPKCHSGRSDVALGNLGYPVTTSAGQPVEVTVGLEDRQGRDVMVQGARLGVGAYSLLPSRVIQTKAGNAAIDEVVEYGDYTYKLAKVVTMDAAGRRVLSLDTPAGTPYIVGYGYGLDANAEPGIIAQIDGLSQRLSFRLGQTDLMGPARLTGSFGQSPREAGQARLKIREGRPTQGVLYLALYLPE